MKKATLALASFLLISACRKGDDPDVRTTTFTAKVNGSNFKANQVTSYTISNELHIEGMKEEQSLSMTIPAYTGPGQYTVSVAGCRASYKENNNLLYAETGTIIILSEDKDMLRGKFNFVATSSLSTKKIEEGSFSIFK